MIGAGEIALPLPTTSSTSLTSVKVANTPGVDLNGEASCSQLIQYWGPCLFFFFFFYFILLSFFFSSFLASDVRFAEAQSTGESTKK